MVVALGIDTGGTYTDGVIVDLERQRIVAKAKALTTRADLSVGINECIDNLHGVNLSRLKLAALSTTLATNAIVEGFGCEVGLIMIGEEPWKELPTRHIRTVKGGHTISGEPLAPLDPEEVARAALEMRDQVDAFAISGYSSVRNPDHELAAKKIVKSLTGCPVVCGHELTTALGFHERTVTAVLNARLIPIVTDLIAAVRRSLSEKQIDVPLMIVKGDGSLISEEVARERPIETILSGPAASLTGATFLTGVKDGIVLDMGGTTTDIAVLVDDKPHLSPEGATVGGWLTRVQAVDMRTTGIGGDSYLQVDKARNLRIGPQRAVPLSVAASQYPNVLSELKLIQQHNYRPVSSQPVDFLYFVQDRNHFALSSEEQEILDRIREMPRSLYLLSREMDTDAELLSYKRLEKAGMVTRVSLTPTDILHVAGLYNEWNTEAALVAADIQAGRAGKDMAGFVEQVRKMIADQICLTLLEKLYCDETAAISVSHCKFCQVLLDKILGNASGEEFGLTLTVNKPILGIGAPAEAWLPEVARTLNTDAIIPPDADVANAVGAITGRVIETMEVLVSRSGEGGFLFFAPWERKRFNRLEEAKAYGLQTATEHVRQKALKAGAGDIRLTTKVDDMFSPVSEHESLYLETRITVSAVGNPKWLNEN